jgi:hypothetical protein
MNAKDYDDVGCAVLVGLALGLAIAAAIFAVTHAFGYLTWRGA